MAFVTRSPKLSYFTKQQPYQQDTQPPTNPKTIKPDKRIHLHKSDKHLTHISRNKTNKQLNQQNIKSSQIQYNNKIIHFSDIQKTSKFIYNFNTIKKSKITHKTQQNEDHQHQQINLPQFYDLPSSISKQTMVKYVKPLNAHNKQLQQQSPGPASYEPKMYNNAQTHKFQCAELLRFNEVKNKDNMPYEEQEKDEKQNYPLIRYKTMNSSNFKKPPNLINYWNRVLLKKLFHHKSTPPQQRQSDQQQQHTNIKEEQSPTFGKDCSNNLQRCNSHQFGKAKRFSLDPSQGSSCFYELNINKPNKQKKQNSNFVSEVKRFTQQSPSQLPLQYQNYQKSFIRSTKNRKYIAFDSNTEKSLSQNKIDKRPYYDVPPHEKPFSRFSQVQINRCNFEDKNQDVPGPGTYEVNPNWNREFGCLISRATTPKFTTKPQIKDNTNQKQQTFFLASPSTAHLSTTKQKIAQKLSHSNSTNKKLINKIFKQQPHKFYNIAPQWQKKSFNRYFTDQILLAHNPTKNKIF